MLRRLSHPFWFQSFGAVMGMDWHSSGITTSVIGALKRGLAPMSGELGLHVCGGRGAQSRKTPHELALVGERVGFDGGRLATASRLVAKVDSAAVQDGFDLYLHGFIVADDAKWVVVQQGMNGDLRQARRYHWLSEGLDDFVDAPHAAIEGRAQGEIVNLTDRRAAPSRRGQLDLLEALGPDGIVREAAAMERGTRRSARPAAADAAASGDAGPSRRSRGGRRHAAPAWQPSRPPPNAGRRTMRGCCWCRASARARCARWPWWPRSFTARLAASPIRRASRWPMAARTGIPSPCPTKVYDETIGVLKSALLRARLGQGEELAALGRLDEQARRLERYVTGPSFKEFVAGERDQSHLVGGRSVFGWETAPGQPAAVDPEGGTRGGDAPQRPRRVSVAPRAPIIDVRALGISLTNR